jgi:hypothetical protein
VYLTLHGQCCICYEIVFTSRGRSPHDILRSPHPSCADMTQLHGRCYSLYLLRLTVLKYARSWGKHSGFTSPSQRFQMFQETYSLLILIDVRDTPGPNLALGEPSFYHIWVCSLLFYLVIGVLLQNSKLHKVNPVSITTWSDYKILIWASKCFLTIRFLKISTYMMYCTCNDSDTNCDILPLIKNG